MPGPGHRPLRRQCGPMAQRCRHARHAHAIPQLLCPAPTAGPRDAPHRGRCAACQPHPQRTQPLSQLGIGHHGRHHHCHRQCASKPDSWQPARGANRPGARHRATTERCLGTVHPTAPPCNTRPGGPGLGALGPCRAGRHAPARHQPTARTGQPRAQRHRGQQFLRPVPAKRHPLRARARPGSF